MCSSNLDIWANVFLPGIWWLGFGGHHTKLGSSARLLCIGKSQNLNISSLFFIWNMGLIKYLYSNIGVADSSSHFLPFSARASHCTTWYTTTLIQKTKDKLTPGCMGTPSLQRLCSCSLWSKLNGIWIWLKPKVFTWRGLLLCSTPRFQAWYKDT